MLKTPLSITHVARLFDVRASALRYYEDISLLKPAWRQGGRRFYDLPELKRLALIQLLQDVCHLSLAEIADVLNSESNDKARTILGHQVEALERQIAAAHNAKRYLEHRLTCPRYDPVRECPVLDREVSAWLTHRLRDATSKKPVVSISEADVKTNSQQPDRSVPEKVPGDCLATRPQKKTRRIARGT
ncbi:MerR family transcriptional regulator [Burkholderia vietnamiensis]|uniref:MerR family transcriptional regulator n=1 Tax=Burkholderia vietnamiensis TaxID=60552 RepID=UPI001B926841|nr:MerR family transcriptional regulator [Burkholderia vietnamiensis]MBR8215511.1 MerR family transcriptional regulator [Burkholderia vietnamiensis]HDV8354150.1 MerR family transcriptional regulator [Burkholderia vietnamiensis]